MVFSFERMFRMVRRALFESQGTNARLTPKRVSVILMLFPTYVFVTLVNWIGLLLDEILFRGYRKVEVRKPVFIVGPPRGGTTFVHRLLAGDTERFTCLKLWETLVAPSITQKKLFLALGRLDRRLGGLLARWILAWEKRRFEPVGRFHKLSFFEAEEDEPILLNIFSTAFLSFMFPFEDEIEPLIRFDLDLPERERARIMRFYKQCIQRHLFVFGRGKQFLSKNPAFSVKVESLMETFSDAKIVCMIRSPMETLPSTISLFSFLCGYFMDPLGPYPMRDVALKMLTEFYRYPLERSAHWTADRYLVVKYDTLIANPERTVLDLYERFGFTPSDPYRATLRSEGEGSRRYKSGHDYSLEQFGLTPVQVVSHFGYVFDRFGFDTGEGTRVVQ